MIGNSMADNKPTAPLEDVRDVIMTPPTAVDACVPDDVLKAYSKIIRKHVRSDRYGFLDSDGVPKHANGKNSPGRWCKYSGKFQPYKLTGNNIRQHLEYHRPFFVVNRPDRVTLLVCVDIDAKGATDALDVAARLNSSLFAGSGFIEPSRKGRGAYVWLKIHRDVSLTPVALNDVLNKTSVVLRSRNMTGSAQVDAIKGTLFHRHGRGVPVCAPCYHRHSVADVQSFTRWYGSNSFNMSSLVELAGTLIIRSKTLVLPIYTTASTAPPALSAAPAVDGPIRRARLFRSIMTQNPNTTEDEFVSAYVVQTPGNNAPEKARKDFRRMKERFVIKTADRSSSPTST